MAKQNKGLLGFIDAILNKALGKPSSLGGAAGQMILLNEIIKPILEDFAKQVQKEAVDLAKREWKKIVLRHRIKPDKQQVLTVAAAMEIVDAILAEHDGAASWLPHQISDEMSRQFYHALRAAALPKKGHSIRGRWAVQKAGRPRKGVNLGQVVWHRDRGAR